jgi:hypothetical protein
MNEPTKQDPSWAQIEQAWTRRSDDPDRLATRRRRFAWMFEFLTLFLFWL